MLCQGLLFGALSLLLGTVIASAATPVEHQTDAVFRIGIFDRASGEFAEGLPEKPVAYKVGRSEASHDWYATQRVEFLSADEPLNAAVETAPRSIQFEMDHLSAPAYRLHVSLLIESPSVPAMRVVVNGRAGLFYLHPELDWNMGDRNGAFDPAYSHADLIFDIPRSDLHLGANSISIQAIEREDEPIPGGSITYDAIELDPIEHVAPVPPQISPTVFYRRNAGGLSETVDVFVRAERRTGRGLVDLEIGDRHYEQRLSNEPDFGDQRFEFEIPALSGATPIQFSWSIDGRKQHLRQTIVPAKQWTVFMVPHLHLDIGFTTYQGKVAAAQARATGEALDLIIRHPEFRFSLDGEWALQQFMATSSPSEQQRAIAAIQKRGLFVPAQYADLLTGFPTAETLIRSLYPSSTSSRNYGTPFDYANDTDVPSYTWSYASILASAGIHDFLGGSDNARGPVLMQGHLNETSPFWWEGPDGKKVLFWYSRMYTQMMSVFGGKSVVSAGRDALPIVLQQYEAPGYRSDEMILFGSQAENSDLYSQQADLAKRWNQIYAYPHLVYSGVHDAMESIATQLGDNIPTIRGDGGPYWEDGVASDARHAALERENESRAPSAEKLATVMSLVNPQLAVDMSDIHRIWQEMVLMDEHTWTGHFAISDPDSKDTVEELAFKDQHAVSAHMLVNAVMQNSMARIVDSAVGSAGSLFVFNTLNWGRSGLISVDIDKGSEIVDAVTNKVVPLEVTQVGDKLERVNFIAPDIPAFGYKRFEVRPESNAMPIVTPVPESATVMENSYYRVTLAPETGAIREIYDKQLGRELVNTESPYRFGQYLYVSGGDKLGNSLLLYRAQYQEPKLDIEGAHEGRLISVSRVPYGWVAQMECSDTNTPAIKTEVRLFDGQKKIEIVEELQKEKVYSKEGVYFAFPFAMNHPEFRYEIQTGTVDPTKDMYPGAGHEWFSVQHWVSVQQDGVSATVMPLDASLVTLGDINRGAWPSQFGNRSGTIFSYVMNNYWYTNYQAGQGGKFRFRYVITSASATKPADLDRMGWEEMTPLETDQVIPPDRSVDRTLPLQQNGVSFLQINDPNVLLETWKPAENGEGTILRFLDLDGTTRSVSVHTPLLHMKAVWLTDAVERNEEKLQAEGSDGFRFPIGPHQIVTVRMEGTPVLQPPLP